jgi:formylglycine-generating enzyme required for sulfatase activity
LSEEARSRADRLDARVRSGDSDERLRTELLQVLEVLERRAHGLRFRYIPAGDFEMGSDEGDADERPAHRVTLSAFWMSDAPLTWEDFCRLMEWHPPPVGLPPGDPPTPMAWFDLNQGNKIRLQYCEDETLRASDWHRHYPPQPTSTGETRSMQDIFGFPRRGDTEAPFRYSRKPMVAVSWFMARDLGERLSTDRWRVDLPTEAQWERAARGLHRGKPYPWGAATPTSSTCDCDRFDELRILHSRAFPPNDYGLYAMSGGVWEWCRDHYDAEFYAVSPLLDPCCESLEPEAEYVLRGGSWADFSEACTVSFRMSLSSRRTGFWGNSPNVGFRLALVERDESADGIREISAGAACSAQEVKA